MKISLEKLFLGFLLIVSVLMLITFDNKVVLFGDRLSGDIYGRIITGLFIVLLLGRFIMTTKRFKKDSEATKAIEEDKKYFIEPKLLLIMGAITLLYIVGMVYLGYFTSTVIFLIVSPIILSTQKPLKKDYIKYTVLSLLVTVMLYIIFNAFDVYLPETLLI